jgi:hypothetical protein
MDQRKTFKTRVYFSIGDALQNHTIIVKGRKECSLNLCRPMILKSEPYLERMNGLNTSHAESILRLYCKCKSRL